MWMCMCVSKCCCKLYIHMLNHLCVMCRNLSRALHKACSYCIYGVTVKLCENKRVTTGKSVVNVLPSLSLSLSLSTHP